MEFIADISAIQWILILFAVAAFLLVIPFAVIDIFRSEDHSIQAKIVWLIIIFIAPFIGAIIYLFWGRRRKRML